MTKILSRRPDGIGIQGSDSYEALDDNTRKAFVFQEILKTGIRYALSAPEDQADDVCTKLLSGESISVATSNRKLFWQTAEERGWAIGRTIEIKSSVEVVPYIVPGIEAVFDIVDTGNTLKDNNLAIVADQLAALTIGAIWKKNVN